MTAKVLVVCAMHRDHRELGRLGVAADCIFHDYASLELEEIAGTPSHVARAIRDPDAEVERLVARCRAEGVRGVFSTDDYPGACLAAIVAAKLGLPGPSPRASLTAQHKYCARVIARSVIPESTPDFALSSAGERPALLKDGPVFTKPCKSFFSVGASAVRRPEEWNEAKRVASLPPVFFDIFNRLCREYAGIEVSARHLLVERLVPGVQCTVEGFRHKGHTQILGIVDSVFYPGRSSFARFEYPSSLPAAVQEHMARTATRIIEALGYDEGVFNVEMMWDRDGDGDGDGDRDRVWVIEVNPRASSQFADLFEKVDGVNTYSLLLDLALGRPTRFEAGRGPHAFAASCVLRTFADARVDAVPNEDDIARAQTEASDARVEVLVTEGKRLSEELQDGESYRYGIINLGGKDREDLLARLARIESALPFQLTT